MKNYLLLLMLGFVSSSTLGQLKITSGTQWVNEGAVVVVLNDIDLVNDGTVMPGNSTIKFTGNTATIIGGSTPVSFHDLEMAKTGSNKISLSANIFVARQVLFTSGLLDLNLHNLTLASSAYLQNETESSRVTGTNGGEVIITLPMDAPAASNPGNLGAIITSASNLGAVTIRRGHRSQSGTGMQGSIQRYFDISPTNNAALGATFRYHYFDAELNGQVENSLRLFKSTDAGINWSNENFSIRNTTDNYLEIGVNSFSRWTASSFGAPLADLTASQLFTTTQVTAGGTIDEVVVIRNVETTPTTAPIVFTVSNYSALTGLTVSSNMNPSVTIGFTNYPLANANWSFNAATGTFTSIGAFSIPAGGSSNVGVRIVRGISPNQGANGTVNQTVTITNGTGGGETLVNNNTINNLLLKNQ
jgi:hypothetical protein